MKLGFIGMGNMASAILQGALKAGFLKPDSVWAYDIDTEKMDAMGAQTGIGTCGSVAELIGICDVLLMAVKPEYVAGIIEENRAALKNKAILSIARAWNHEAYYEILGDDVRVAFIMPNTPHMVGEGVALLEETNSLNKEELAFAKELFGSIGQVFTLKSNLMDVGSSVSGCGPAFIYMVMEALADGAVMHGLPRQLAYQLVSQTVLGSGKMLLETGIHPGQLKDNVCSPGGSTIRGVRALEDGNIRSAFIDAIDAATAMN